MGGRKERLELSRKVNSPDPGSVAVESKTFFHVLCFLCLQLPHYQKGQHLRKADLRIWTQTWAEFTHLHGKDLDSSPHMTAKLLTTLAKSIIRKSVIQSFDPYIRSDAAAPYLTQGYVPRGAAAPPAAAAAAAGAPDGSSIGGGRSSSIGHMAITAAAGSNLAAAAAEGPKRKVAAAAGQKRKRGSAAAATDGDAAAAAAAAVALLEAAAEAGVECGMIGPVSLVAAAAAAAEGAADASSR